MKNLLNLNAKFDMKSMFFDRRGVINATEAKERRVLINVGSYVRTTARSLIPTRKRPQKGKKRRGRQAAPRRPGMPPVSYTPQGIRRIFYYYDKTRNSVGIGPDQFGSKDVPGLLEFGGIGVVNKSGERGRYRPHPFMGPALAENEKVIMDAFEQVK